AARTNIASGDEVLVGVPYRPHETDVHRMFVRLLATTRAADRIQAGCLAGPSLAVRRADVEAAGGLRLLLGAAPVTDLARRAAVGGRRLVIAEGSYLHHAGGPGPRPVPPGGPRPFVSACLITKDEHDNLPRCLASVKDFADEVVVYDTGSTDDTRQLARAAGAVVVEGFWDDDFARARNAALSRCTGQWILWIDADEALACADPVASRQLLAATSSDAEGLILLIDNLRGTKASTAFTHPACRLFRRAYGHWTGRLHEQVTAREGSPALALPFAEGLRITHWGYLHAAIGERDKGRRNIRSALGDLGGAAELPWATRLASLGRSYNLAGRPEEGIELCRAALAAAGSPATFRLALRSVIEGLLALDRAGEALVEIGRLRASMAAPMLADTEEGRALLALGRCEEALAAFGRVTDGLDDDGYEHRVDALAAPKASALAQLDRHHEAADTLLAGLRSAGGMDAPLGLLVECLEKAGRPLAEIPEAVPPDRAVAFLGQLVHLDVEVADRALDAWYSVDPSRAVLATSTKIAAGLPVDRQRTWSERLRAEGLGHACPLVTTAAEQARPATERLLGAAVAAEAFGDRRGRQAFAALALAMDTAQRASARNELARAAPSLVGTFDSLAAPASPLPATPGDEPRAPGGGGPAAAGDGRRVLVVDWQVSSIRTMAIAAAARRHGHHVTLAHPQPAAQTEELLGSCGVEVCGWERAPADGEARGEGWRRQCAGYLARLYAEQPFDAVVLGHQAAGMVADVRRLLPAAHVVVDADYDPARAGSLPAAGADLVLSALPAPGRSAGPAVPAVATLAVAVAVTSASAPCLYPPVAPVPYELRTGVCVVGDFGAAGDGDVARWEKVAEALGSLPDRPPVAMVGDDVGGRFVRVLPAAVPLGPLADPRPWLRTARVAVVAVGAGAEHWLAVAALCGTPALVVPEDPVGLDQVAPAVAALAGPGQPELWARFAPAPQSAPPAPEAPAPEASDPLASLPAAYRRHADPGRAVEVRRGCPPDLAPPTGGRLAIELSWPFGGLPTEWLGPIRDFADEIWVPGAWARDQAVRSGVDADRIRVVPPGVDGELFSPDGSASPLATAKQTKLLFVGDCSDRSGADALLEAYLTTFTATDDVCLVVGTAGTTGGGFGAEVRSAATGTDGRAEVEVVDGDLDAPARAALYRSCDLLVHPHRADASPRTVLEAMACGLPVVTLDGGACRDVCDRRTGWLVACRQIPVDPAAAGVLAGRLVQLEPDRASLRT
ncbi:MAG: glycosyltransferase, partial [Acidimicrobiales bacterium]